LVGHGAKEARAVALHRLDDEAHGEHALLKLHLSAVSHRDHQGRTSICSKLMSAMASRELPATFGSAVKLGAISEKSSVILRGVPPVSSSELRCGDSLSLDDFDSRLVVGDDFGVVFASRRGRFVGCWRDVDDDEVEAL